MRFLAALLILVLGPLAAPALGQGSDPRSLDGPALDPETGEPVPLALTAPVEASPLRGGKEGELTLLQHLAEGATKLVRTFGDGSVFFQNGAYLVTAEVALPDRGGKVFLSEFDRLALSAIATDAVIRDGLAFVTLRKGEGLAVLDLAAPDDLQLAGQVTGFDAFAVAVAEIDEVDYAFVGLGLEGVRVYDVSTPAAPALVTSFDTPGSANGLAVTGTTLLVADGNVGDGPDFRTYDVADPAEPMLLGTLDAGGFVTYVVAADTVAYLAGAFGLMTVGIEDPAVPTMLDTYDAGGETTYEVALGDTAAVVAGLAGLFEVDVRDPADLAEISAFPIDGQGLSTALGAGLAFLADRFEGLRLLERAPLEETGFYRNGGFSHKPLFDGTTLYVTDLAGALRVFDVADADAGGAVQIARAEVPSNTQEVHVRDSIAYVTDADFGGTGLTVLDVSDPANPQTIGSYGTPNQAFGLDLDESGDVLYLANGFTGLQTLDVSDPADPQPLGSFPMGSNTVDVVWDFDGTFEEVAYAVNFGGGMYALDVDDPADIQQLDAEPDYGFLNAIALPDEDFSGRADVADALVGLRIVDVAEPDDLQTDATFPVATQARDVASGTILFGDAFGLGTYVADDFYGIRVFSGKELDAYPSADRGIGVASDVDDLGSGDLVALAAGEAGVYLFRGPFFVSDEPVATVEVLTLEAPHPNPLRSGATVSFMLPEAENATLELFDLLGRRVATLAEGPHAAGSHAARLDAAALPSGVYVLRLTAGGHSATQRVTVVR